MVQSQSVLNNYKGCISCFACKKPSNNTKYCEFKDNLTPLLKKIYESDAIILGSPMYFDDVTGEMRSFLERLWFPYASYTNKKNLTRKNFKSLFIYTMNRSLDSAYADGYREIFERNKRSFEKAFGNSNYLVVTETYQWDYSIYPCTKYDGAARSKRRKEVFPLECQKSYDMAKELLYPQETK